LGSGEYLPKFVKQYAHLADDAVAALEEFFSDVESGIFPSDAETYHMPPESEEILRNLSNPSDHLMADEAMES
jgi:3-methyl-2-oxobutanoate hydroxymethyltransferase